MLSVFLSASPRRVAVLSLALAASSGPTAARAQSPVVGWGSYVVCIACSNESFVDVASGNDLCLARRADGTMAAWGDNRNDQALPPSLSSGLTYGHAAGGDYFWVSVLSDGSILHRGID